MSEVNPREARDSSNSQSEVGEEEIPAEVNITVDGNSEEALLHNLLKRMNVLESELTRIKKENSKLEEENSRIKKQLMQQQSQLSSFEETIAETSSEIDEINSSLLRVSAQADGLNTKLESTEDDISELADRHKSDIADIQKRVQACESSCGIVGTESDHSINTSACKLEQYSCLPETLKDNIASDSPTLYRAIILWEEFDSWSDTVYKGKRIETGKIKRLLETKLDTTLQYVQVNRAMEKFEELTPERYFISNSNSGSAIVYNSK